MTFPQILRAHFTRYPSMQPQDVYKLVHQAAFGSEHAVTDVQQARQWLARELAEMGEGADEPLLDLISPENGLIRLHLRPFLAAGADPEALLLAFVRTANTPCGGITLFEQYWSAALDLARWDGLPVSVDALQRFLSPLQSQNYPAIHHSEAFARLYRPAYRVVRQEYLSFLDPDG